MTIVMALGRIAGNTDELGQHMLEKLKIDVTPNKNFKSMREALEHNVDREFLEDQEAANLQYQLAMIQLSYGGRSYARSCR